MEIKQTHREDTVNASQYTEADLKCGQRLFDKSLADSLCFFPFSFGGGTMAKCSTYTGYYADCSQLIWACWPRGRAGVLIYVWGKVKGPPLSERTLYLKLNRTLKKSKALYSIIAESTGDCLQF